MAARSRKRGRRAAGPPGASPRGAAARREPSARPAAPSRSEARNAEVRTGLEPLGPGERPWPLAVSAALCVVLPVANFILLLADVRPKIGGHVPSASSDVLYLGVMLVCAVGMWQRRYWAVLGFMVILLVTILTATLALIRASNLLGFVEPVVVLAIAGTLFYRLVRVLSRLQMPRPPGGVR